MGGISMRVSWMASLRRRLAVDLALIRHDGILGVQPIDRK